MPRGASQIREFSGKSMREIIKLNKRVGRPTLSPESINKHLSMVGTFFSWAVDEGHASENVMDGLKAETVRKGSKRATITVDQMQRLFDSPLFTGCMSDANIKTRMTPGALKIRNWRYWVPLLAAFTGARQGELLQLEVADVMIEDGIDFLLITDEGDSSQKAVKTSHSRRRIPVHSTLRKLGFLKFVAKQQGNGHTQLFPDLKRNDKGYFNYGQKELGKMIDHMKFPLNRDGNKVVFHSFRHAVADQFRRRFSETEFQPLLGHKQSGVTRGYGVAEDLGLVRRLEIIEEITYSSLDLSRLTVSS